MIATMDNAPEINLHGRQVLVTGAARGLGESFARALVAAGAQVVISDVLHERGRALAMELGACYVAMDLSDPAAIATGIAAAVACFNGLDGLVQREPQCQRPRRFTLYRPDHGRAWRQVHTLTKQDPCLPHDARGLRTHVRVQAPAVTIP